MHLSSPPLSGDCRPPNVSFLYPMPASPQTADERKLSRSASRSKGRPEVSVVLVADGCWETTEGSLSHVAARCRRMLAEVIVIQSGDDAVPARLLNAHPEVRFCAAPAGCSETQLRSIAMLEASGDIVALRRAADCGDAFWLDAHFRLATGADPEHFDAFERSAYDGVIDQDLADEDLSSVELTQTARRTARHSVETSPASSASSAA